MRFKKKLCVLSSTLAFTLPQAIQSNEIDLIPQIWEQTCLSEGEKLTYLFNEFFEEMQKSSPEFATFAGITKEYNGLWTDHSSLGYEKRYKKAKSLLQKISTIQKNDLSESELLNYNLLQKTILEFLEGHIFNTQYLSIDHLSGIPLEVESILMMMPQTNELDYEDILSRLSGIPILIDQTIDLLCAGVEKGITQPKIVLGRLPQSIEQMMPQDHKKCVFFQPFVSFPDSISIIKQKEFVERARKEILEKVYPAYSKLHSYLVDHYIPACRETIGASHLPNGKDFYRYCISRHTTTNLDPLEIHEIGLREVKRIHDEMQSILKEIDFSGTIADYLDYLNSSSEFFYDDPESLLQGYRDITSDIEGKLPLLFGRLPTLPYEIVPVPQFSQEGQIGAYYMPGSIDTGRPGRFYVNTYDLNSRPKWNMESLALHEAVPGHHFQISVAQEIQGLPQFRKYTNFTAYIEGWGLYSESLGYELGLYRSPDTRFGRLVEEIMRAVRLVVDTGIHALGWSRDEAIAYMQEKTGLSIREVTTEIDRYIVWPGQALAYKIGEMSIKKWRQQASDILGPDFDIREFHDMLLEKGALPLDYCDDEVARWIDSKLKP